MEPYDSAQAASNHQELLARIRKLEQMLKQILPVVETIKSRQ